MNKLKKLFSPSLLAATVATGMLLASAVTALANVCVSVGNQAPGCSNVCPYPGASVVWCCDGLTCGPFNGPGNCGWCYSD